MSEILDNVRLEKFKDRIKFDIEHCLKYDEKQYIFNSEDGVVVRDDHPHGERMFEATATTTAKVTCSGIQQKLGSAVHKSKLLNQLLLYKE